MKLNLSREALLSPLQKVIGAVERKQTMPILSNVLIKAQNGELNITATDLEIELIAKSNIDIIEEGAVTLPAKKLYDICKNLPDGADVSLTVNDGDKATIASGRSRFKLSVLPANDFPSLDDINVTHSFSMPQVTLRKVIEKTAFAMAQQDVRYYLNGLMVELSSNTVRAVATDGHRLALSETEAEIQVSEPKQVIIPRKGVLELVKMLNDEDQDVVISLSNNHIRVDMLGIQFTSKLIDGRFPDYQRVIPTDGDKVVSTEKQEFRLALTRTAILSNEKYKGVRLALNGNTLSIQTHNPEQEEAEEELQVDYAGEAIEIGFNVNYMLDVLNVLQEDTITIEFKDSKSSCLLQEKGAQTSKYVVMPMRL